MSNSSQFSVSPSVKCKERDEIGRDEGIVMKFLAESDYTSMLEECRKELDKKSPNRSHLKHLLKETFAVRRREIVKLDEAAQPMVSSILEDWPCLEFGEFVSVLKIPIYIFRTFLLKCFK